MQYRRAEQKQKNENKKETTGSPPSNEVGEPRRRRGYVVAPQFRLVVVMMNPADDGRL